MTSSKACAPFDDDKADIILRSSDGIDFFVYQIVLSLASPFFKTMFQIPQPPGNGLQVIPCDEDSTSLYLMLWICYPCRHPEITALDDLEKLLAMADKYDLQWVVARLESRYMVLGQIGEKPVRAFIWACRYSWCEVARAAAKSSLFYSVDKLFVQATDVNFLSVEAKEYDKLFQYHFKCRTALKDMCKNFHTLFENVYPEHTVGSYCGPVGWKNALSPHMDIVGSKMATDGPLRVTHDAVLEICLVMKELSRTYCAVCQSTQCMRRFTKAFEGRAEEIADEIELNLSFRE